MYLGDVIKRNNVNVIGEGDTTIVLAHGFGCDQKMWRYLQPYLEPHYKLVLFDYVGSGQSDTSSYDQERYRQLDGYSQDIIDICDELKLKDVILIGHSVSSTIGMLCAHSRPDLIKELIMICPSPCFLNIPPEYIGGFEKVDLEELINLMDKNYIGWANYLAPLVMGTSAGQELTTELTDSFCSTNPLYLKPFAKATFFSDYRHVLPDVSHPTLIIQSKTDNLAAVEIGNYMSENIPNANMDIIDAEGHCLHMSDPEDVYNCINSFRNRQH
jgi:sigma-B regulation protein RsbQ